MMISTRIGVATALVFVVNLPLGFGQLDLSLNTTVDISALGLKGMGGAGYDDSTGRLWISDGCGPGCPQPGTNLVFELDPLSGNVLSSFDAGVIPGLDIGADSLAIHPSTGNLFLFSAYIESEAGEVNQHGAFVREFPSALGAAASGFSLRDELIIVSDPNAGGDGHIHRVNQTTGAIETTVPIVGYSGRVPSLDFDPLSGNLIAFADTGNDLLEVDPETGDVLSVTDLSQFGIDGRHFATALSFKGDGRQVYLGKGVDGDAGEYLVLDRGSPWKFLGNSLPGTQGKPFLSGDGSLTAGSVVTLSVDNALPNAPTALIVGTSRIDADFSGGVFVPSPDIIVPSLTTDASGELALAAPWPGGLPSGFTIFIQCWITDSFGPQGFSATNAISGTTP